MYREISGARSFLLRTCFGLIVLLVAALGATKLSARPRDTIEIIRSPASGYVCCYDLLVRNRQTDTNLKISEFRFRIISGRAQFVAGVSESPPFWTVTQSATEAIWTSNAAAEDIDNGEILSGFHICMRDTGIARVVWETRNLDSVITADTIAFGCRGVDCDEAFFRTLPSETICAVDFDIVAGNSTGRLVNDVRVHPITPGVTLKTSPAPTPAGWIRLRSKSDTIVFFTNSNALDRDQFAEGFRVELNAPADSTIRLEWWTASFGELICRDTVTIRCGLTQFDTVLISREGTIDSCCQNIRLKNTHVPTSPIDAFTIEVTSNGGKILSQPQLPQGWESQVLNAARDSIAFRNLKGLSVNDTALFKSICFDNAAGRSDTLRYTWQTWWQGVAVNDGVGSIICPPPLTSCDSVTVTVDSTVPATQRCISLSLRNRNSRKTPIQRFVVRIENAGRARTILSAQAPSPWVVQSFGGDSAIFTGGQIVAGGGAGPFVICLSQGDSTTRDPVTIRWSTSNNIGPICGDSVKVNAIITNNCDLAQAVEKITQDQNTACFDVKFLNRNGRNRTLDQFRIEVRSIEQVIFSSATAPNGWSVATTSFPSFDLDLTGGSLAAGDSTLPFTICLDMSQRLNRPITIPVLWRSFSNGQVVCTDTLRLVVTGQGGPTICDTVSLLSQRVAPNGGCRLSFGVVNSHTPAGPIDGVRLRITQGTGTFMQAQTRGAAAGWTADLQPATILFRGSALASGSSLDTFIVRIDTGGAGIVIESCTMNGDQVICCSQHTVVCSTSDVELSFAPTGFRLHENIPNPFSGVTEIRYDLLRAASVTLVVRDAAGAEMRRIDRGHIEPGSHSIRLDIGDLPSGIYYYSLEAGGEVDTRRMVMVK